MNPKLKPILDRLKKALNDPNISKREVERIKKLLNPNLGNSAFGAEVADKARKKGVRLVENIMSDNEPGQYVEMAEKLVNSKNPKLQRLGKRMQNMFGQEGDLKTHFGESPININPLDNNPHFQKDLAKETIPGKKIRDAIGDFSDDKLREAEAFPHIGQTESLYQYLDPQAKKKLTKILQEKFPNGYIVKKRDASNSISSRGTKDAKIFFSGDKNISRLDKIKPHELDDWIIQPDKKLQQVNPFLDKLDKRFFPKQSSTGVNEYRVTIVNGKVVPYATKHRGNYITNVAQSILPFRTPEIRKVERYAQEALDAAHPDVRKGNFAFDVGFDATKKPTLVETNPGYGGVNGLYFKDPTVPDAIRANIQEKLPYHVLGRRALWGTAGLAGLAAAGAGAVEGAKMAMDNNAQEQAYINGFVKRAAEYGLDYSEALNLLKSAEKPGLWANIRAKRARGEKPAKPGDEDYPDKKQWSKLTKDAAESAAWQRSEGKNPEGGLNAKGRASYKAQTGGTLKLLSLKTILRVKELKDRTASALECAE